jgi:hexosaminidase
VLINRLRYLASVFLFLIGCSLAWSSHSSLLPLPAQIQYGVGSVSLRGIAIAFSSLPGEEDKFAAQQLATYLEKRTGLQISILSGVTKPERDLLILLDRAGQADLPLPLPGETPGPHAREAYDLSVTAQQVEIHATSSAGIFYGVQTLRQLVEGNGTDAILPVVEIHDWPSVAYRGTMVDISHGPLPTENEIDRQLDFLARWKGNQYYLYSEASIELAGYPLINANARLIPAEVHRIVAYGRQRHIDVIPDLELYAHMHDVFRIEQYSDLSDLPNGTEFDPRNSKVMPFIADWVGEITKLFPSPFIVIGFDEPFQIDVATRLHGDSITPADLIVQQLTSVTHLLQAHGKTVMALADMMIKYPQVLSALPPGLVAIPWHFTSEDPEYKSRLGPLVAHHVPHLVQPGAMNWAQLTPDFDTTFENIDTFLNAGRHSGALGLIDSMWADSAQLLCGMSLPAMAYGAAAPWQSTPMGRATFLADYANILYSASAAPHVASALKSMAKAETELQKALGEQTMFAFWWDPFFPPHYTQLVQHRGELHQTRLDAEQAEAELIAASGLGADPQTVNALMIGSRLLDYAGQKFQTALQLTELWQSLGPRRPGDERWWNEWESQVTYPDHSRLVDLMDAITELRAVYHDEWLREYAPYRLGTALGRWDAEYEYWRHLQQKLLEFSDATHEGDVLPSLQQLVEYPLLKLEAK